MEWKTLMATIGIASLFLFAIPIRFEPDQSEDHIKLFEAYVVKYNKTYGDSPAEYEERFEKFKKSLRKIEEMNSMRRSEESAVYGLTRFSDMSENEFLEATLRPDLPVRSMTHLHHRHHHHHRYHQKHDDPRSANRIKRSQDIPLKFDWRDKGFVTSVRSQKTCGACWAFSTVEVAETMYAIKNGTLNQLSVQEMIDCAGNNNLGCNGGDTCSLLMWLAETGVAIQPESRYPMTWTTDQCKLREETGINVGVRVTNFTCDNFVDAEDELMVTIARHGPVAAAVNALSWQNYLGGVIQFHCDGKFENLNHAVQIVGYDRSGPVPFYVVRNSWGPNFGRDGYLYIAVGTNLCGIANQVSSLDVA